MSLNFFSKFFGMLLLFFALLLCPPASAEHSIFISPDAETRARLIFPEDFVYEGAFKFPSTGTGDSRWGYGGSALTYYPSGDPNGLDDGYPGSLYGVGHDHHQLVSEISIPEPVIPDQKRPGDLYSQLNAAQTLQPFADVTGGLRQRPVGDGGIQPDKVGGVAYLPRQGSQKTDKLYWTLFKYYHVMPGDLYSHGWSDLDLSNPLAKGLWHLGPFADGNYSSKRTANYVFDVPVEWADEYLDGKYLISGKGEG
jgi:hypothetical protein